MKLLTIVLGVLAWAGAAGAQTLYLTADRMIDVERGVAIDNPALLIEDGVITQIAQQGALTAPEGVETIALDGMTILPGLIDMHVHLHADAMLQGFAGLVRPQSRSAIEGVINAETTLMAGFTTVRNVGSQGYMDVSLRNAINDGDIPGPRLFVSGPPVGITGGHCSDSNGLPPEMNAVGEGVADGPWAARAAVRRNVKYGVDLIKTCSTGGVFSFGTAIGSEQYTVEELTALVEEAHLHGRKVASHAHGTQGIKNALMAGVDTIEHASLIDEEGVRMAIETGAYLSMDIYVTEFILGQGEALGMLEDALNKERQIGQAQRDNFQRAHEMGAKIVMGTDAGVYPHGQNARQLARMVRFGMSPAEALQAATVNAADALGQSGQFGAIAVGQSADIIAVEGDPLEDISILEEVGFVMKEGRVYKGG